MRIDRIELIGFKSFADKIIFSLHPGITCIVGPNGCGKSNIVDAFRWVLGEQSAKSLRGEKMEEVIFNGSALKKPKGMAEVTLHISGMNLPARSIGSEPGSETGGEEGSPATSNLFGENMTVSRRLYRSGESEYMINKNPCRLKDIRDVFLDTGLDFRSYSILEQGRIGEIVNSKPNERRFIIEEVAGVMKYKVRKAEALSKLESSRLNLLRVSDIIAELRKQINILDRLAKKAERYKKLSTEMYAIELKIARVDYQTITESRDRILEEHRLLREKEAVMGAEISETENRTESRRLSLLEKEKGLELLQSRYQTMEREIAEIEREIAVARQDVTNLGELFKKLQGQDDEIDAKTAELNSRCDELRMNGEKLAAEIEAYADVLREKTEAFREIEDELAGKEEQIEAKRREIFRISEELSSLRNELNRHQTSHESLERRETTSSREAEEARKALQMLEQSISEAESAILGNNNETLLLKEKKEVLQKEFSGSRERLELLTNRLSEAREELASNASRLDSLKEIVFDRPTRELISSKSDVRLLASIADIMDVESEYERAIESALAEKADSFVLESREDIEKVLASIKGAGRTALIPLAPHGLQFMPEAPQGIIGKALSFVRIREGYSRIAENLLGNVLIVKDIKTAFDLREQDLQHTFVTLNGEVIEPSGAVIAGEGKGIFLRKREIRELEELIDTRKSFVNETTDEIQKLQETIRAKEEGIRAVEASIINLEKEISLSRLTVDNFIEDRERTGRKLSFLTLEIEDLIREKSAVSRVITDTLQKIQSIEEKKTSAENESLLLQEGISLKKSEIEGFRAEVTDIKLMNASNREKAEAIRNEIESSGKAVEALQQRKTELLAEREEVLQRVAVREADIAQRDGHLKKLVSDADLLKIEMSGRKEEIDRENEDLMSVEHGLKTLRHEMAGMTARISELDVMKAEHKLRIENLSQNVMNNYGVQIGEMALEEVTTEEEERLAELRTKIQEIGPVNLGSLEEYEELRTRYEFMTTQHDDLTKSIAELEEAISKINSTTRKKLKEAFEMLNEKFREVFVTLFGGGRAELVLTDENNILESGIEIVVQPPGKKLQNIHLLSGGEKALTALSVQFASFLIKPTPLCILDEADAPLDESNTERYAQMLHDLSNETQFIVVTHNRTTMNVAQHLYGITMEEAGVSKVISMQLADVAA